MPTKTSQKSKSINKENYKYDKSKNFIHLFLEQANNNPDKIIVVSKDDSINYNELNRKSDRLARYLRKLGIKSNDLVGLCTLLNTDFIVCMLGIIKSGAVYFPLDPTYPMERVQYMLKDAKPKLILTELQFSYLFKHKHIIEIDQKLFNSEYNPESNYENIHIQPNDLAYVIYTSGSTGQPKGIMITHKSLPNIALAHNEYYPSNMKMLVSGGVCFDASLLVILHALINNEPLYLFNYNIKDNIDTLFNFIQVNSINYMISVPSQYLKLLKRNHQLPFLKCVSLTGENLPKSLCHLHARVAPNAILYNEYGPSECAIGTTIAKIYDPKNQTINRIRVGKSLPNTQVYILDQNLNKVPKGSKGEICIGGIGLAKGYLNKETLTTEKFVYIKMSGYKLMRVYRTGDIGRFLPNGELEFLGRIEHDTQIGKNWINLGEIEHYISQCSYIQESIVLLQANSQGEKQLIVYITSSKKSAKQALMHYLQNILVKDISFSIIQIDKFPLSPNGKIDRDALLNSYEEVLSNK